ncbi:hypothetical protein scyTo_0021183 [Scyliorhinus torazame]|uniref:Uncharacterized protein n=1 Tax=Scyliorhinus torazame TaxID=75743 RepID=A0A401PYT2_SCYTO|nr:hypothetical protein [Scyliorhinus torazame]
MQDENSELETPLDICTEPMSSALRSQATCKLQDRSFEGKSQTLGEEKGTDGFFITQPRSLAEFTSHKSKADQMEAILKNMREQRAKTIIPLAHVLRGKGVSKKDYEEAVQLLRDLQLKYQEARERLTVNFRKLQETCEENDREINSENLADEPDQSQE